MLVYKLAEQMRNGLRHSRDRLATVLAGRHRMIDRRRNQATLGRGAYDLFTCDIGNDLRRLARPDVDQECSCTQLTNAIGNIRMLGTFCIERTQYSNCDHESFREVKLRIS